MTNKRSEDLLEKYNKGLCSEEEKALVEFWYMQIDNALIDLSEERVEELGAEIYLNLPEPDRKERIATLLPGISVVAALIALAIGTWFYFSKEKMQANSAYIHDVSPGGNKATLTLATGKIIDLADTKTGIVIDVNKLRYNDGTPISGTSTDNSKTTGYQSITTPKGGQYQITLPDSSKVWLNAASTIKFPVSFKGSHNRSVILNGEAYFEIARDKIHPFIVKSAGQKIQVLGTHFNVNSYADEAITKTTLLEGSVLINGHTRIKPGEQALGFGDRIVVKSVDTEAAVDWKNGEFIFKEGEDFRTTMRKIARWYNVEIVYDVSAPANYTPGGWVSRSKNISDVLKIMEEAGEIHFKIEGRRITVTE